MNRTQKIAKIKECKYFVKGDAFVFAACLLLIFAFTLFAFGGGREEGDTVEVFSFGEQIASLPLHEDGLYLYLAEEKRVMRIPSEEFAEEYKDRNLIVIKEGKVRVKEADCPDLTCVRTGARSSGEIICLPHGLTLKIAGGLEGDA